MTIPNNISFTYEEVIQAFKDCVKNKQNTWNAQLFSKLYVENCIKLTNEINNGTYEIGPSITFCVTNPKLREVFAADFRDRVVHHLIMNELMPLFEQLFITNSYSCRKEKGVLYGVNSIYEQIKQCTKDYTVDAWILKMDLKSFFMSIDKRLLADRLDEFIVNNYHNDRKKEKLRVLCKQVIMHHPERNCEKRGDESLWNKLAPEKSLFKIKGEKGLPIGNLTSQVFANFYLHPLDKFITEDLGFKYYGRYVDDFVIICEDKKRLLAARQKIFDFTIRNLGIEVHPDKVYFQHYLNGVKFIGAVCKKDRTYIGNRTKGNLHYKLWKKFNKVNEANVDKLLMVVNSYFGFMIHHKTYKIRKGYFKSNQTLDKWKEYVVPSKDYKKVIKVNKKKKSAMEIINNSKEFVL